MNYTKALATITADTRFGSLQDYDPELLEQLEYWNELPAELKAFCRTVDMRIGTEPYYEHVLYWLGVKSKAERE
ncbi:hypothetical protein NLY09_08990 (plasmid) [Burkholderia vietnamiensis]